MNNQERNPALKNAIFLDRDGVVNVKLPEDYYVKDLSEFTFLPNIISALCILKNLGYLLVIVTNQRGIARGYMTEEDLKKVHDFMITFLKQEGVALDGIYYCPHDATDLCTCRKPRSGMIFNACRDLGINLADSFMVGDSPSDMVAGKNAGTRTIQIGSEQDPNADLTFPNLMDFALYLKNEQEGSGSSVTATFHTSEGTPHGNE